MRSAATAAALLVALLASGCGTKTVDDAAVEKGIKEQVTVAGAPVSKVDCPSGVESTKGATFNCSVSFENGATSKVKVTEPKRGTFQYALVPGSVQVPGSVAEKEIVKVLDQKGSPDSTANCPDNIIVKVGTYVVCDVTFANGRMASVKFTFTSEDGTVDESSVETT